MQMTRKHFRRHNTRLLFVRGGGPLFALIVLLLLSAAAPASAATSRHRAVKSSGPVGMAEVNRVFMVILENADLTEALPHPFLAHLAVTGALLRNYHAIGNPSQPNYIALTSGDTHGVTNDNLVTLDVRHLGDLFDDHRVSWKVYAESYPGGCFLDYADVQKDKTRCAHIVNATEFDADLAAQSLPQFMLYIPNNNDDGHDTSVAAADTFMQNRFGHLLDDPKFMAGTLFVVLFDEGHFSNVIYVSFNGAGVRPGATSDVRRNHYDMLRTIEEIFHVGTLGQKDASASVIDDVWKK
jgi:hypothetical protein